MSRGASPAAHRAHQLARYDAVIHLRTPPIWEGYNHQNPLRTESAAAAAAIDARLAEIWTLHPRRYFVDPAPNFVKKAADAIEILRREVPECCREQRKTSHQRVKSTA
jgi:hypothetical protein